MSEPADPGSNPGSNPGSGFGAAPGPTEQRLRPLPLGSIVVMIAIGMIPGWLYGVFSSSQSWATPASGWYQAGLYLILALGLAATAWGTARSRSGRNRRLSARVAVNRFVMGRAAAVVASLMTGAYLGFALSWWRSTSELAERRIGNALVTSATSLLVVFAALALERACRVPKPPQDP
jgi:hypothetical protein